MDIFIENMIATRVASMIKERYGYEVETKEMDKINVKRIGLSIKKDDHVAATIYIPDALFYSDLGIKDITDEMIAAITENIVDIVDVTGPTDTELNTITDILRTKEKLLNNVVLTLINKTWNTDKHWVTTDVDGDLEYIYQINVSTAGNEGCIRINQEHLDFSGITVEELHEAALRNTPEKLPGKIEDICDMLLKKDLIDQEQYEEFKNSSSIMYVVSNTNNYQGAAAVIYPEIQEKLYQMFGEDYIIIPSSIHECIILNVPKEMLSYDMLNMMVKEVNADCVNPTERLSDHVYKIEKGELISIN